MCGQNLSFMTLGICPLIFIRFRRWLWAAQETGSSLHSLLLRCIRSGGPPSPVGRRILPGEALYQGGHRPDLGPGGRRRLLRPAGLPGPCQSQYPDSAYRQEHAGRGQRSAFSHASPLPICDFCHQDGLELEKVYLPSSQFCTSSSSSIALNFTT